MLLTDKATSAFPVSIGTSLSLESIFTGRLPPYDVNREIPQQVSIGNYSVCYINVATLFRNLIGALPAIEIVSATPKALYMDLEEEIEIIDSVFKVEGNGVCQPIYYIPDYSHLVKKYATKKIQFRVSKTEKQLLYDHKYRETTAMLSKSERTEIIHVHENIKPTSSKPKALILTHVPYDLLSYKYFHTLDLIESHTGKLKTRHQFSSKYYSVGDLSLDYLPFTKKLLLMLGDRVLIQPADIRVRKLLLDIASNHRWTPFTTDSLVDHSISLDVKDEYLKRWMLSL